jgi:hypothetical protein
MVSPICVVESVDLDVSALTSTVVASDFNSSAMSTLSAVGWGEFQTGLQVGLESGSGDLNLVVPCGNPGKGVSALRTGGAALLHAGFQVA